jgi:hypothetical protein
MCTYEENGWWLIETRGFSRCQVTNGDHEWDPEIDLSTGAKEAIDFQLPWR